MSPRPWPESLPGPLPLDINVLLIELDLAAPLHQDDLACLRDDEHERVARLYRHADKVRFVRTRTALRRLLGAQLHCNPKELSFMVNRYGKPSLQFAGPDAEALHFNVSHAGSLALIALSARVPVGVDIERRDPTLDVSSLQPQVLSDLERRLPASQRPDFFECWAAKEAVLKCLGLGVGAHLRQLSVLRPVQGGADGEGFGLSHAAMVWPRLAARRLRVPAGHVAALAWQPEPVQQP